MEDSHALIAPFNQVHGQGFFAVFDGHAGKHAAEWCGQHFHEVRLSLTTEGYAGELTSPADMMVPLRVVNLVPPEGHEKQPDLAHSRHP